MVIMDKIQGAQNHKSATIKGYLLHMRCLILGHHNTGLMNHRQFLTEVKLRTQLSALWVWRMTSLCLIKRPLRNTLILAKLRIAFIFKRSRIADSSKWHPAYRYANRTPMIITLRMKNTNRQRHLLMIICWVQLKIQIVMRVHPLRGLLVTVQIKVLAKKRLSNIRIT